MNTDVVASVDATVAPPRRTGHPLSGLAVYATVVASQIIAVLCRSFILYLPLAGIGLVAGWPANTAGHVALAIAFAPLLWSIVGLFVPAEGWLIQQRYGGRQPSARETAAYADAMDAIHTTDPDAPTPRSWFVVDQGDFGAAVLGDTLMIVRERFHDGMLEPTLAHELGHLAYRDGRITVALIRVNFLARQLEGHPAGPGLFAALARQVSYVASGQLSMRLLTPLWAGYFRECEYRADAYAARLGYARELIDYFEGAVAYDQPVAFAWMKAHSHPPTELRIDRLQAYLAENSWGRQLVFPALGEARAPQPPDTPGEAA